jgi:pimeloyl-ACP methyl ester carboxylesterase
LGLERFALRGHSAGAYRAYAVVKPPRLLLLGEEETTPEWVERARSALSNTDIAVLPNLGHISGFLASDEAVQAVRPFLARV